MLSPTKIVAFLQNTWHDASTPQELKDRYRNDAEFRKEHLLKSMTGRRLHQSFGEVWYRSIHWDNVGPEPAEFAAGITPVDIHHVQSVLILQQPELILTYGNIARLTLLETLMQMSGNDKLEHVLHMACHHPNARHKTQEDLNLFALIVKDYCKYWPYDKNRPYQKK